MMSVPGGRLRICRKRTQVEIALQHLSLLVFHGEKGIVKVLLEPEDRTVFELKTDSSG